MVLPVNLTMFLPVKMIIEPGTQQGWEGTGVIPDIKTCEENALSETRKLILQDILSNQSVGSVFGQAIEWTLEDDKFSAPEDISNIDTSLVGNYTNNVSIILTEHGLIWRKSEPGKTSVDYTLRKVKPDVYTIINLNKSLGAYSSRIYVNRNRHNGIRSLTRKTLVNDNDIRTTEDALQPLKFAVYH